MTIKNKNRLTPQQLAERLGAEDIATLLESRFKWHQTYANTGATISLNRALRLFDEATRDDAPITLPVVMVFGYTQSGKTTLLNYLMGIRYKPVPADPEKITLFDTHQKPFLEVGNNSNSKTIYSTVLSPPPGRYYVIADMPGIGHTLADETKICVAASRRLLLNRLTTSGQIKAIVFVCAYNELTLGTQPTYKKAAGELAKIIKTAHSPSNVLFIVTKTIASSAKKSNVIDKLEEINASLREANSVLHMDIPDQAGKARENDDIRYVTHFGSADIFREKFH